MRTKISKNKNSAVKFLDELIGEDASIASELWAFRTSEDWSQEKMAKKLGISRVHYSQLEGGRKFLSPERAAAFAKKLGYSEKLFVQISLQDQMTRAKIPYRVILSA